jgi:hypothetical protein
MFKFLSGNISEFLAFSTGNKDHTGSKLETSLSDLRTGLKGGGISFRSRASQLTPSKNGWAFSSAASPFAPRRCLGLRLRSYFSMLKKDHTPLTKDLPSGDRVSFGKRTFPNAMFLYICWVSSA